MTFFRSHRFTSLNIVVAASIGAVVSACVAVGQTYQHSLCKYHSIDCPSVGVCPGPPENPNLCFICTEPEKLPNCEGNPNTTCQVVTINCGYYHFGICNQSLQCILFAEVSNYRCNFQSCTLPTGGGGV